MIEYIVCVLVWSFAIYGLIVFLQEYLFETICYIIIKCVYIAKLCQKYIDKNGG